MVDLDCWHPTSASSTSTATPTTSAKPTRIATCALAIPGSFFQFRRREFPFAPAGSHVLTHQNPHFQSPTPLTSEFIQLLDRSPAFPKIPAGRSTQTTNPRPLLTDETILNADRPWTS